MVMLNDGAEGLTIVTVKKADLLSALIANREKHVKAYREAMEGYREEVVKEAEKLLARVKDGDFKDLVVRLSTPVSHEKDYTKVINMLTMSVSDTIKISDDQFMQYVEDEWNWRGQFEAISQAYSKRK